MITTVTLNASIDKAYHMEASIKGGEVMRVASCRNSAGGKGLNVARIIRLCGSDVKATGMVGGYNGKYLESLLDKDGVDHCFYHINGETRSCINILDEGFGSTEFLEPGCEVSEEEYRDYAENVFPEVIADSDVVTISGSVPKGVPDDFYAELVKKAKDSGKTVVLDTSGILLEKGLKAAPDMVKPNKEELEKLFKVKIDNTDEVIQYAKKIYDMGVANVVVSLGKDGALLVCGDGIFRAKAPKAKVVNTVGCGDSMVGAFAVAFERKYTPEEALKYAVAIASANACSPETGNFDTATSRELYYKTEVSRL